MKCKLAEQLLPAYIEGTLSPKRVRQLEFHIGDCLHCQKELQTFEKTIRHASHLPIEYPSPEAWQAFWPDLHTKIKQNQFPPTDHLPLWIKMHRWKLAGGVCLLIFLLSLWGVSNSRLFSGSTNGPTVALDQLISQSFIAKIPVAQLQEQLNHEFQSLDAPLVWGDEDSLVDEMRPQESMESNYLVNQVFQLITTEIDIESFGDEALTDLIPSMNDQFTPTALH